jgi:hypothetical protein
MNLWPVHCGKFIDVSRDPQIYTALCGAPKAGTHGEVSSKRMGYFLSLQTESATLPESNMICTGNS